jgi:glutamate---cysteine ligase / carboxylate-amine ligase
MEHVFGRGAPFSLGVEEELMLVRPPELELVNDAERVLAAIEPGDGWEAAHELYASEVELRCRPVPTPGEAAAALGAARAATRAAGGTLMGAGLHPTAARGDVEHVRKPRYERVEAAMRGLARRTPECALHLHVGMPDADSAVRAFNGLRGHLPLLGALAANSPYWYGQDSGLASARAAHVRAFPSRGIPRALRDFADYEDALAASALGGGPADYTLIWWDVRLHPRLGTVELRELDVQSGLDSTLGIAALAQALGRLEAESDNESVPSEAIIWSAFRAARDGLDAEVLSDGRLIPVRDAARGAIAAARPYAPEPDAFDGIERILRDGGGADRQRAAYGAGGMPAVLEQLVKETNGPAEAGPSQRLTTND